MTVCIDQFELRETGCDWGPPEAYSCADEQDRGCMLPAGPLFPPGLALLSEGPGTLNERRRTAVLSAIEQSLESGLTGGQMAASVGLSKGAFHRAFKATFGTTPFRYLTRRRVEAAAAMMVETDLNLGAIAVESGFYDQAHLCRQFRRVFGESPTHWRRRHRKRKKQDYAPAV